MNSLHAKGTEKSRAHGWSDERWERLPLLFTLQFDFLSTGGSQLARRTAFAHGRSVLPVLSPAEYGETDLPRNSMPTLYSLRATLLRGAMRGAGRCGCFFSATRARGGERLVVLRASAAIVSTYLRHSLRGRRLFVGRSQHDSFRTFSRWSITAPLCVLADAVSPNVSSAALNALEAVTTASIYPAHLVWSS